ncbi:hypothetical protein [Streptomyces sp. NPDC053048]|uniref:hypothetical protein n=1 Tax=Streptomyces sp. NPDC053048 TaxID=3365694 RepID=UPI0037D8E552
MSEDRLTRTELKKKAQDEIMHMISMVWHHWRDTGTEIPSGQREEFDAILKREADRAARLYGYEEAWMS